MKRFKSLPQVLWWGLVAAVLGTSAQAVEPAANPAPQAPSQVAVFNPLVDKVAPVTSFELTQLAHHFDLSHDAQILSVIKTSPTP